MLLEVPQQLNCPICMSLYKIPITTECGHSFCRSCLINSAKTKKVCPMCRQQFQNSPQKLKQDDALSHILQDLILHSIQIKKKQDTSFESKGENMLLLDVKTDELILPYNKSIVTFELQNPILLNKRQKLVARQQYPFNKYGIISRIVSLNKLRHNLYECVLEGKSFCVIQDDTIEQGVSQMQEQFFYRTCKAKEIIQTSNINPKELQPFLYKLKIIQDPKILHKIYDQIDRSVFINGTDPLAMIYSIFGILDLENEKKYQILTLFDEQKRISVIKRVLQNIRHDVRYNIKGFIKIRKEQASNFYSIMIFCMVFVMILWLNSAEAGEL